MEDIDKSLGLAVHQLSDENYAHSLAFYRFWFDIGQAYHPIPSDQILDAIWNNRGTSSSMIDPPKGKLIHSTAHLIVRFASDAESDHLLAPHSSGLRSRLCARVLREFFSGNLRAARSEQAVNFYADANLIAHWVNLGYVEEVAIRNHILQSLISCPKLYDHQADAIIILFKLAGATFEAYADPSVIDRCFELLKDHKYYNEDLINYNGHPEYHGYSNWVELLNRGKSYDLMKKELVQVRPSVQWKVVIGLSQTRRRSLRYGSVAGRASLHHLYSRPGGRTRSAQARETPPQLPLSHPLDFLTRTSSLRSPNPLHPNRSLLRSQTQFLRLPSLRSLILHPSASPLCPTS